MENPSNPPDRNFSRFTVWFKRVGIAGFLFFLLKGIAWLFVFAAAGKCALG
ncbi:MAG: hypothetical protein H6563_07035 [Lewinellaceae bacterium]|nr:hypothetical protein [Lewinellaceae bacterium]